MPAFLQLWQRNFNQKLRQALQKPLKSPNFASRKTGKMAEWSIATVLKTAEGHTSGGSNPSLSAKKSSRKVALLALEREWMRTLGFVTAKRFRSEAEKVIAKRFRSEAEKESLSFRKKSSRKVALFIPL